MSIQNLEGKSWHSAWHIVNTQQSLEVIDCVKLILILKHLVGSSSETI